MATGKHLGEMRGGRRQYNISQRVFMSRWITKMKYACLNQRVTAVVNLRSRLRVYDESLGLCVCVCARVKIRHSYF